ncbi:hypothetical protein K1T71_000953 [Dendrolimus kikuchii]|uniref:Uncharacterized protein n=1 Tax=Dendrolimus kikuchii TaxID=765133 RepID=A0ACC1DHQ8_9NEOP|nr:hypothetical protein K1T71_000953 [Dendrolimus kikuchii]
MDECQIWIFAKSHAMEIKTVLQSLLGFHYNIMTVWNATNDLAEALYSKKEMLRHLTRKDHIIIIGGLDEHHLNDNQFSIKDFCSSLQNINIILCDESFSHELKSIEQRCRHVRCIVYHKYSPAQDIIDCVCRLLQKEIQNFAPIDVDNNYNSLSQPGPSASFTIFKERLYTTYGSAGDAGSSNSYAPQRNSAFNAYGDTRYHTSTSKTNNLKTPREVDSTSKESTQPK